MHFSTDPTTENKFHLTAEEIFVEGGGNLEATSVEIVTTNLTTDDGGYVHANYNGYRINEATNAGTGVNLGL